MSNDHGRTDGNESEGGVSDNRPITEMYGHCETCGHIRYHGDTFNPECNDCCEWAEEEIARHRASAEAAEAKISEAARLAQDSAREAMVERNRRQTYERQIAALKRRLEPLTNSDTEEMSAVWHIDCITIKAMSAQIDTIRARRA